ncbi:sensor domain-containing protein [Mycobacterium hubeiense]|uniref:sensor domain-containing protein n=1 Tax=Mycobacterium hubeiense TaxID=1867256 RepID=UPI0013046856|nr:sensor domain-containing protein [Mycobacterium sp. QGD 101]
MTIPGPSGPHHLPPFGHQNYPPPPPGQPPYGWAPPPPPRRPILGWLAAAAAVIIIAVVAVVVIVRVNGDNDDSAPATTDTPPTAPTTSGPSTTPTPSSTPVAAENGVAPNALKGFLVSPADLNTLLVADNMAMTREYAGLFGVGTDRDDCGGAPMPAMRAAYDGSGFRAIEVQTFTNAPPPSTAFDYLVDQAVASFPTTQKAQDFVRVESTKWDKCKYKSITLTEQGAPDEPWRILAPRFTNGELTASTQGEPRPWGCQRTLTSKRNVVIDVRVCSWTGSAQAPDLARQIAARIPAA